MTAPPTTATRAPMSGPATTLHRQEVARLRLLEAMAVLDTGPDPAIDALVRSAATLAGASSARLNLVTAQLLWPMAVHGAPSATSPRAASPCARVVASDAALLLRGAGAGPATPGDTYAGVPVRVEGLPVGTLSVAGPGATDWDESTLELLADLATAAGTLLHARLRERRRVQQQQRVHDASQAGCDWLWETDADGRLSWISDDVERHLGQPPERWLGRPLAEVHAPRADESRASWLAFESAWRDQRAFDDAVGDTPAAQGRVVVAFGGAPVFDAAGRFAGYRGAARVVTNALAARLAAQRAEALLHATLDGLPAGVAVSDALGRIVLANAAWYEQVAGAELPAPLTWPSLVRHLAYAGDYPDAVGREEAFIEWRLGLAGEHPAPRELRWREGWGLVSDLRLPGGHVVHLSVDRTAQKNTERALAALQRRQYDADAQLSAVLAAVPDLWFVLDAEGRYSRVSSPRHPALMRPFEELAGRPFAHGLPASVNEVAQQAMQRARTLGRVQRFEYALTMGDGATRHFEARVSPMPGGELLYLTRDLTEMRALARDVLLMQRVFESPASLPILIADTHHGGVVLAYVNNAFEQLTGWSRDEAVGRPFDFFAAADAPARALLEDALRRRGDATLVVDGVRRDGSRFVNELSIVAARDADGRTTHLIGLLHDRSERRQAEQARQEKIVAEMANRSKSEFMSRMSHEMRTPLNAIIGFAQLLRLRSGTRIDHVDHILDAGRHLLMLVNDVLDLQRAETGELALHPQPLSLRALVDECIAMLRPLADARAVHQLPPPDDAPRPALADAQRLRQVLLNIGSNAIKYNRPAGQVRWSFAGHADGAVDVVVEDTGAGMTDDQLARLFQPFERLGRDTSTIEGTGLGLVIARRLVEQMGGTLGLHSRAGVGTRVTIRLVAAAVAPAPPPPREPASATPIVLDASLPLRLLYVEDNRINALLFEEALRRHEGFELRVAEDGREALELVEHWRPDVLVLDAHLPGASGHEVLRALRERDDLADAPAYMCSADAMPEDVQRALDAGFRGYWTKPLDIDAVLGELQALRSRRTGVD
ncbi:PAS domain-containing protein [Azohydromonas sp.]|uniref:hybrid sensor histidine kinase/response regulator n=1 Tax=Azohydromonas sp. TaxID=1872666 RepID=UPI002C6FFF53|nr:PAS domain-containing protein [Azohydromonas sp.]HMM86006.1 PAS domain-containing protein [Azohydromonas sp.]